MIINNELITKLNYNFVKWNDVDNCVELFCDNHMLSSMRKCESYFTESIIGRNVRGKAWFLDMGIWLHSVIEHMYTQKLKNIPCNPADLADYGATLWTKMEFIKYHSQNKNYIKIGGFSGAAKLLLDYWRMYGETRETYKIIGTELPFGAKREVFLGEININSNRIRCYYSGRIDIIVDDGYSIGIMDTKSAGKFSGDEADNYKPHEGMQGYVYSLREIVKTNFPEIAALRPCNRVIINHVSVNDCKDYRDRFKRTPISYTLEELEEWRQRQLRSFKKLYELSVLQETPDWNSDACNNMYFQDCPYKALHRNTPSMRETLRKSQFVQMEPWNPYRTE